ncbi:MAG TPA: flagellar biosynthetic protein FliO, partial [Polyangiaceae bacterium]
MNSWRRVGTMALFVTILTVLPGAAAASDKPDRAWLRPAPQATTNSANAHPTYVGRWAAALVLAGLSGYALFRRQQSRRTPTPLNLSKIQITALTKISPKAQLLVATVNGRSMLLGVTEANVTRLMWLENSENDTERSEDKSARHRDASRVRINERSNADSYPLPRTEVRRNDGSTAFRGMPRVANAPPVLGQKSRFREILADAIGFAPKPAAPVNAVTAPVDELVGQTADRYIGS